MLASLLLLGVSVIASSPMLMVSLLLLKSLLLKVPAVVLAYLLLLGVSSIASVLTLLISLLLLKSLPLKGLLLCWHTCCCWRSLLVLVF